MIRGLFGRPGEKPVAVDSPAEIARLLKGGQGCLWIDLQNPGPAERAILTDVFEFHEMAVQHCVGQTNHPRLHDYGSYLYMVFHAVRGVLPLATSELDVFLGATYLVTYHEDPLPAIEEVRKRAVEVGHVMHRGPDRVLGDVLDELADGFVGSMESLDASVDTLEDRLFKHASRVALRETFRMKKDVLHLRRVVSPQREVLHRLSRGEFTLVSADDSHVFRDVHDRIARTSEMLETFRDVLSTAMEVYLTVVSNRTNEIVKVLTIVSIILMSASLLTGIYGMNIPLPLQDAKHPRAAFAVILALMGVIATGLLLLFRNRKWI